MKKYQAGGGIREGRARFGDDVRERARQEMARRAKPSGRRSESSGRGSRAKSIPVAPQSQPRMRALDDSSFKTAMEDRMGIRRGTFPRTPKKAKGGTVKKMAKGGSVSKRADGCAMKGKTKGRMM